LEIDTTQLRTDNRQKQTRINRLAADSVRYTDSISTLNRKTTRMQAIIDSMSALTLRLQDTIRELRAKVALADTIYGPLSFSDYVVVFDKMFLLNIRKLKEDKNNIYTNQLIFYKWYRYNLGGNDILLGEGENIKVNLQESGLYYFIIETGDGKKYKSTIYINDVVTGRAAPLQAYPSLLQQGGILTLRLDDKRDDELTIVRIYDIMGRLVDEQVAEGKDASLTMNYYSGTYFVQVDDMTKKIVIE
jgi:hypothetical protein